MQLNFRRNEAMKKVKLNVLETLKYQREIEIAIPDDMTEGELNEILNRAQRGSDLDEFLHRLEGNGISFGVYDDDLSSPYGMEVECDDYTFIEESGDSE
jgi:hypothetical protein